MAITNIKPIGVSVPVGAALTGMPVPTMYRRVADGSVALISMGGRKKISIAKLEVVAGRTFTIEEIDAAELRAEENQAKVRVSRKAQLGGRK